MDILKSDEMRSRGHKDLATVLAGYRQELARMQLSVVTGQLKRVTDLGQLKRAVARALTILKQPEGAVLAKELKKEKKKPVTKEMKRGKAARK